MSKIKIQGNASGTGVVTLTAPNTNTDRTITLPDGDISLGVGIDDNATSTAITIDASENVGIGVTAPQELLHLKDGSIAVGNGTASNNTQVGRIGFSTDSSNSRFIGMESYRGADAANGDLRFHTYGGDSNAGERLRITNDGRGLSDFTAFAWCVIGLDNVAAGNATPDASLNISSVVLAATGNAKFYYTNAASTASTSSVTNGNTAGGTAVWNGASTAYIDCTYYHSNGSAVSASGVTMISFGGN